MDVFQMDEDFNLSLTFDYVYSTLIDVVFVFQTATFVLLIYVIVALTR